MKEHSVDTKRHFFGRSLGSYIKDHFSIYFGNYIIKLTRKLDNTAETNKVTKQINIEALAQKLKAELTII